MIDPLLEELLQATAPSGNEHPVRDILRREFAPHGELVDTRWTGFYLAHGKNEPGRPAVVVTAHMDAPGFTVRGLNGDGSLDMITIGGIDSRVMDTRLVKLRTHKASYPGVLSIVGEPQGGQTRYSGFFGFKDAEEAAKKGVKKGDPASHHAPVMELENGYIVAPHLDNRVGCFLLVEAARAISKLKKKLPVNVYFVATDCEEIGGRGAKIMGQQIEPELAICLDITYEEEDVVMGSGPVITLSDASVILPMTIRDQLSKIAKKAKLPLQFEVYNYAGTDASGFREVGDGCLTICPLIASRHNHRPHEILQGADLDSTSKFVMALLKSAPSLKVC